MKPELPATLIEFASQRVSGGYRIEYDPEAGGGPGLEAIILPASFPKPWTMTAVTSFPPDLYLEMTNLRPAPDDINLTAFLEQLIARFANKYGPLGNSPIEKGIEWITTWVSLSSALIALESGDPKAPIAMPKITRVTAGTALLLGLKPGYKVTAYTLIDGINAALANAPLQAVVASQHPLTFVPKVKPRNLKALLWTQLLNAQAAYNYARCRNPACGNWMVAFKGATRQRVTCSTPCRMQLHLLRKRRALELDRNGVAPKTIATILRREFHWQPAKSQSGRRPVLSPEEQIRRWVKSASQHLRLVR